MNIERRITRLERTNRRWRFIALGVTLIGAVMMGAAKRDEIPELIRARTFQVVDAKGRTAVDISSWKLGGWFQTNGYTKAGTAYDQVLIAANDSGDGMISIKSAKGKKLVGITATKGGNGAISTYSATGKELVGITAMTNNSGGIRTFNAKGNVLVSIGEVKGELGGHIGVYNKTGEEVCTMSVDEHGNGKIGAWNRKGKGRTLTPGP
jgi:hypothetical protein